MLGQLEFYFSDANFSSDTYLRSLADASGWVPLNTVCGFKMMRNMGATPSRLVDALRATPSLIVELDSVRQVCKAPECLHSFACGARVLL